MVGLVGSLALAAVAVAVIWIGSTYFERSAARLSRYYGLPVAVHGAIVVAVEISVVGTERRLQANLVALQKPTVADVAQLVEDAVGVLHAGTGRTPEVVIRRFPVPVAAGTGEPPSVGCILDTYQLFLLSTHVAFGQMGGMVKGEILVRVVKVKVIDSSPRPAEIA